MARSAFESLDVYRLAEDLADEIWRVVLTWNAFAKTTVGEQVVDAADSIGANIAEGYGRGSSKDDRRFIRIARGSLNETTHWMRRAYRRNLLKEDEISRIRSLLDELGPRLNAYLSSVSRSLGPAGGAGIRQETQDLQQTTDNKQHTTDY